MQFKRQNGCASSRRSRPPHPLLAAFIFASALSVTGALAQGTSSKPAVDVSNELVPSAYQITNRLEATPSPSPGNVTAPGPPLAGTSQLTTGLPPPASTISSTESPLHWGPIDLRPHLLYQLSYGNGLQSSPGDRGATFVNQVSPGLLTRLGTHWTLDYNPTLRFYSDKRFKDGTDQSVNLVGATAYQDWTFGFSQGYGSSTQPLIETGSQTDQETYTTGLTAGYQMNSKIALSLGINQNFRFLNQSIAAEQLTDTREWSTMDWLNYELAPELSVGAGVGFTYDSIAVGPDMTSEQIQGRVTWQLRNKLHFLLSGGLNDQQFLKSHSPDLLTPVFSVSLQYKPFEVTTLSLAGSRSVAPSYFQNANTEATVLNASFRQRLLGVLYFNAGAGYGTTAYHTTTSGPVSSNIGNFTTTSFNVGLSTTLVKRASASIFYTISYNSSGVALYNYTITQGGLSLGYTF